MFWALKGFHVEGGSCFLFGVNASFASLYWSLLVIFRLVCFQIEW
jgi:hypothetical protein